MSPKGTKKAQQQSSSSAKPGKKDKSADATAGPQCKWGHCSPKVCKSCGQSAHEIDRDSNPSKPVYLEWVRKTKNSSGEVPAGEECYRCYDVRRRYFPTWAMESLKAERDRSRELDDKFHELRGDRLRGEGRYKSQQAVDVEAFVSKENKDFAQTFVEGTFHEIQPFAAKRRLKYKSIEDLKEYITKQLGLTVVVDKKGTLGVEILDHEPGQYRFKRGCEDSVTQGKKEKYDKKEAAAERFVDLSDKLQAKGHDFTALEPKAAAPQRAAQPAVYEASDDEEADGQDELDEAEDGTEEEDDDPQTVKSSPPKSVKGATPSPAFRRVRSRSRESRVSGTSAATTIRRQPSIPEKAATQPPRSKREKDERSDKPSATEGDDNAAKKRRRCSSEVMAENASMLLEKTEKEMSWSAHWHSKGRRRDFDALCGKLESFGRKAGAFLADENAMVNSQRCFDLAEKLRTRQAIFDKIRSVFLQFSQEPLDEISLKHILEAPASLLCNILTMPCQQLIEKCVGQPSAVQAIVSVLGFMPGAEQKYLSLSLLGEENAGMGEQAQRGLVLAFAERVLRSTDLQGTLAALKALDKYLERSGIDLGGIDIKDKATVYEGFFGQSYIDLHCVRMCGLVLGAENDQLPRGLRLRCVAMVSNAPKLSSRLKSLFKNINGSLTQFGKNAWDKMEQVHKDHMEHTNIEDSSLADMKQHAGDFAKALSENQWQGIFNFVVDLMNNHGAAIKKFGDVFRGCEGEDSDSAGAVVVRRLAASMDKALSLVLGIANTRMEYIGSLFTQAFLTEGVADLRKLRSGAGEEETDPRDIETTAWIMEAITLQQSLAPEVDVSKLQLARKSAEMVVMTFEMWSTFSKTNDGVTLIRDLCEVCASPQASALRSDGVPISGSACPLQTYIGKVQLSINIKSLVEGVLTELFAPGDSASEAALRESLNKQDMLPPEASDINKAAVALLRLKDTATKVNDNKDAGGLLGLGSLLSSLAEAKKGAPKLLAARPGVEDDYKTIEEEFMSLLRGMVEKSNCKGALESFSAKYEGIFDAAESWCFDSCPWVYAQSTDEEEQVAKKMEMIITQHSVWQNVSERLSRCVGWAPADVQTQVKGLVSSLQATHRLVEKVAKVLGCMVLASLLAKAEKQESPLDTRGVVFQSALRYVQKTLAVKTEDLPATLRAKIQANPAAKAAAPEQPASKAAARPGGKALRRLTAKTSGA